MQGICTSPNRNTAYYIEALARVGVEPDETIMVGDSLQNDILPAQQAGLHTLHVQSTQDLEAFYQDYILPRRKSSPASAPTSPRFQ